MTTSTSREQAISELTLDNDGHQIAVYTRGNPVHPTVVLVHGFPDDHSAWDGIANRLAADHHVVTYDGRGAGASSRPKKISDYRLDAVASDLQVVVDAFDAGDGVHVVGHDWGSVQAWHLVTSPAHRGVRSFTSISGPCLDHVPGWVRRKAKARRYADIAAMWKSPLYMTLFSIPGLAMLLARAGLIDPTIWLSLKVFERPERLDSKPAGPSARRNADSIRIYAANVFPRMMRPTRGGTAVPVQILTPVRDAFVPPITQADPHPDVQNPQVLQVPGGHWAPTYNPVAVTALVRAWIAGNLDPSTQEEAR